MKTILRLLVNDLKRDWKRPWAMLLLAAMPLVLSALIALIFGGQGGSGPMPTVHVAVLDQDEDMLTGMLRSLPTQGDAARNLRLHFVENREQGLRLVEKDQVSALVVLPKNMTEKLLQGQTNSIELYENPAQQVLPKVVRQGVSLLALGLSAAADLLGDPLREMRDMIRSNSFPAAAAVGGVASNSVEKLGNLRSYVFPPLVRFETVPAAEFQPLSTNPPTLMPGGSNKVTQASSPASSCSGGTCENNPAFQRWVWAAWRISPAGTAEVAVVNRPFRDSAPAARCPSVETLGYFQPSLRDNEGQSLVTSGRGRLRQKLLPVTARPSL